MYIHTPESVVVDSAIYNYTNVEVISPHQITLKIKLSSDQTSNDHHL